MGKAINSFIMVADCSKPADFLNPYNLITSLHYIYVRVINWKEKKWRTRGTIRMYAYAYKKLRVK